MERDIEYRRQRIRSYRKDIEPLFRYLPWLESKRGAKVSVSYKENAVTEHSMGFPVYDGTLMGFVKEVQKSTLIDRNYVYLYSRYRLAGPEDERKLIAEVTIKNPEVLTDILSRYILGGMTKGWLWSQAVEEGIYLDILLKFKELFDLWDQPMAGQGSQE